MKTNVVDKQRVRPKKSNWGLVWLVVVWVGKMLFALVRLILLIRQSSD